VPELTETLELEHSDPKVRQPVWYRYYNGTSQKRDRDFSLALDVGLDVLGGGNTSLLYVALVEEQKVAVNAGTFAWTGLHDNGPAVIYATPSPGVTMEELETAIMAEITSLLDTGFSDEDVTRVRNSMAASAIYARDSQQSMANLFGSWLAIGGSVEDLMTYEDDIRAVTTEQALSAVRQVFATDRNYIEAQLLPAEGDL
ncbi:MAG: insulinase family protein, partial [Pseudomonadota bacterium]